MYGRGWGVQRSECCNHPLRSGSGVLVGPNRRGLRQARKKKNEAMESFGRLSERGRIRSVPCLESFFFDFRAHRSFKEILDVRMRDKPEGVFIGSRRSVGVSLPLLLYYVMRSFAGLVVFEAKDAGDGHVKHP